MKTLEEINGYPMIDELEITRYYPESKNKEVRRIVSQKDSKGYEMNLEFDELFENIENVPYIERKNPVDYLIDEDGYVCIQHVSSSGIMEELKIVCTANYYPEGYMGEEEELTSYLLNEAIRLRSLHDREENDKPERFLVVIADAMDWNSEEKIHKNPDENERLEGIYDTYDEAYKVLEEASRSGTPNLTVEIRREIRSDNEDKWYGLTEPPLDVMTTDIHGNVSNNETLHFPECEELDALRDIRDFCPPEEEILETQKEKPLTKLIRRVRGR